MGLIDERIQSRTRAQYVQTDKDQLVEGFQKQIKELKDNLEAEKSKEVPTSTINHTKTISQLPAVLPRKTTTKTETETVTSQKPAQTITDTITSSFTDTVTDKETTTTIETPPTSTSTQ